MYQVLRKCGIIGYAAARSASLDIPRGTCSPYANPVTVPDIRHGIEITAYRLQVAAERIDAAQTPGALWFARQIQAC